MAEVKSDEGSFFSKRKPDLTSLNKDNMQEKTDDSNKKQKLEISSIDNNNPLIPEVEESKDVNGTENINIQGDENGTENITIQGDEKKGVEEDEDDEDEEDYEAGGEDDDEEDDDSDDDHSNGNAEVVDLKGKGIMMDDKGKGKLIEESEDSSEDGSESDADADADGSDSDLSDDPLAEVDMDNILPTRTRSRRRVVQPGIHISDNQGFKKDDTDDSDDN